MLLLRLGYKEIFAFHLLLPPSLSEASLTLEEQALVKAAL